jgi:hypothetical protein
MSRCCAATFGRYAGIELHALSPRLIDRRRR